MHSKNDQSLYVDEIKLSPPPPTPGKFEIWYAEMFERRWFRCLNGLVMFGIGWTALMNTDAQIFTIAGWAAMIIGGLIAFEISLALLAIYFVLSIFDGLDNLSTPKAIVVGACIIAYVIYIKRK